MLKWKKAQHCHQATHCGTYWVERDPNGGHMNRWHAHRKDLDEQITSDGFDTREDAKRYCENEWAENSWAGLSVTEKLKLIPKGLQEFHASLYDPRWGEQLLPRLLKLSEEVFAPLVKEQKHLLAAMEEAERQLSDARRAVAEVGERAFRFALKDWTVKQLQDATGYDDE